MTSRCFFVLTLLAGCFLGGCSTTLPGNSQKNVLDVFVHQSEQGLFFWPSTLTWEGKRFGFSDLGQELSQEFVLEAPVLQLMRDFSLSAGLSGAKIVIPGQEAVFSSDPYTPVLFFSSSWELIYRRLPPNIYENKLRMGVVAKVIPLAQVLEGKGPVALRTSAWEGHCTAEAFEGDYFRREQWEAEGGALLKRGLQALQKECGHRLAEEFKATMNELNGL